MRINNGGYVTVTRSQMNRFVKAFSRAIGAAMLIINYYAVRDVYGHGAVRMARLHRFVEKVSEEIDEGLLSYEEIKNTLMEEIDAEFMIDFQEIYAELDASILPFANILTEDTRREINRYVDSGEVL